MTITTQRFIEDILFNYSECTTVVDDIHTGLAKGIKRANEATAEEMIRRIADDTGRGHKEGNSLVQRKFDGNVVFIGEYTIGKESSVPRALVANLTKRPNSTVLDKYQRQQPLVVSTFYYYFIQWYVDHFNEIQDKIDERLTATRAIPNTAIHLRLRDTEFYLQTAFLFFLAFCRDSGFITTEDMQDEYRAFNSQLTGLIQAQQARISPDDEESKEIKYLKLIRRLCKSDSFKIADTIKEFEPDKHDGLIHYGCLCIRKEKFDKKVRKNFSGINPNDVIKGLKDKNVLKLVDKNCTVQISALKGSRFVAIWLDRLD